MSIRILIADDHGVVRSGLTALLEAEPDFEVVGEAADGTEALQLATTLRPDLVLLDISMPDPGGIEVTRQLRQNQPDTRVLILTVHEDGSLLREAIRAGAQGYIVKRAAKFELIAAIQSVCHGGMYVHPALIPSLVEELPSMPAPSGVAADSLSQREIEILRLIVKGHTNRQIGEVLCLSTRTVEGHRANLMSKLGLKSRVDLVRFAAAQGLLE